MKRLSLSVLALALAASLASAQDFEKAKKEFREAVMSMNDSAVHSAALAVAKADNRESVDCLLDGYGICATQLKQLWVEKVKWQKEVKQYENFEVDWTKNPPIVKDGDVAEYKKWQEATSQAQAVEKKIMSVESVKREIVVALATFKSDPSVKELINKLKSDSNWARRAGICEALGSISHADAIPALVERLKSDSEGGVKVACCDALRAAKAKGPEVVSALCDALKNEFWQVKYAAALALKGMTPAEAKDAFEPLIECLKTVDGRLKNDLNEALVALTGVDKHADYAAWRSWFDSNKESVKKGEYKPAAGDQAGNNGPGATTTFYGVPVKSKNVIFVLDHSGSMAEPSEWDIPADVATGTPNGSGPDIKKEGDRKIDIARWQLKRTMAQLPDGTEFNIIIFNHEWKAMSEKMIKMAPDTRKQALAFIDKIDPVGGTNTFDPMEKAFSFAGGADKMVKGGVDTIFLLTDGMPNAGQVPKADDIVTKIREMNKSKKITINTIGVFTSGGKGPSMQPNESEEGSKFLKQLSDDSGGTFVSAMKGGAGAKKK